MSLAWEASRLAPLKHFSVGRAVTDTISQASDNPLEVSPANPEVSQPRDTTEGGSERSSSSSSTTSDRQRSSGGSSPSKGSKVA